LVAKFLEIYAILHPTTRIRPQKRKRAGEITWQLVQERNGILHAVVGFGGAQSVVMLAAINIQLALARIKDLLALSVSDVDR
jgi:hypothetical protein